MGKLQIVKFGGLVPPSEQRFKDLETLIEECGDLYPGIDAWYKRKALTGLKDRERTAYVIYEDEKPVGATIVRLGKEAKICSLRIKEQAEQSGYGTLLMALAARDLRNTAEEVHFTIPDHIWTQKSSFFEAYGFEMKGKAGDQYRLFDQELYCRSSFANMWLNVLRTLPSLTRKVAVNGLQSDYDLVLSVQPEFAKLLVSGKKQVEIRKRFSEKWIGSHALVYSTLPDGHFVGSFRIKNVVSGEPSYIWSSFGESLGCSRMQFEAYTRGSNRVFAIITGDPTEFRHFVPMTSLSRLVSNAIEAPQSYMRVMPNSAMDEAAAICTILQSTLQTEYL